jgi:chromosome segregation ATPase
MVVLNVHDIFAEGNGVGHYLQLAEKAIDDGKREDSLHYLNRAILLDPDNAVAKQYLKELGVEQGHYPMMISSQDQIQELKLQLSIYEGKFTALRQDIADLKDEIMQVREERDQWMTALKGKEMEALFLQEKILQIQGVAVSSSKKQGEHFQEIESLYQERMNELQTVNQSLAEKMQSSGELGNEVIFYQQKYHDTLAHSVEIEQELHNEMNKYTQLANRDHQIYAHQDKLIKVLEDYTHLQNRGLNDTQDQLVFRQMDLLVREHQLLGVLDELEKLNLKHR